MADYIEKDRNGCYDDTSTDDMNNDSSSSEYDAFNNERWAWLIYGWDKMDFAEKYSIFFNTVHFINLNQTYPEKMDVEYQKQAIEFGLINCRPMLRCIDFEVNRINAPQVAVSYGPVYYWCCPDKKLVAKIDKFYSAYVYPTLSLCNINFDTIKFGTTCTADECECSCPPSPDYDNVLKY